MSQRSHLAEHGTQIQGFACKDLPPTPVHFLPWLSGLKQQIRVEPLTRDLFLKYEGNEPPMSVKGFSITIDGEPVVVACVSQFTTPAYLMFDSKIDLNNIALKRNILIGWNKMKHLINGVVLAHQDKDKPTSGSFMRHFGFEPLDDQFYIYRGD